MHYFKRNIGDYHKKAGRLSMLQHGAYTLLLDACYDREQFPTYEEAIDWCWALGVDEINAVDVVLRRFFNLEDGVYIQKRIKDEIEKYHANAKTNSRIAKEREAKKREKKDLDSTKRAKACTDDHERAPNQEPLTINQEPLTNIKTLDQNKFDQCDRIFVDQMIDDLPDDIKKPNFDGWSNIIRLMRVRDNRVISEMYDVWSWTVSDDFWSSNILSATKFRKQYDTLKAQMLRKPRGSNHVQRKESLSERTTREANEILADIEAREASQRFVAENEPALRSQVGQHGRPCENGEREILGGVFTVVQEN